MSITINFDDFALSLGGETGSLGDYQGFSWTKTYVYQLSLANCSVEKYDYCTGSTPNIGLIGHPDSQPVTVTSLIGDVSFLSVYVTNPGGSATDPDGPITVTIQAFDNETLVGTKTIALADYTGTVVSLDNATFKSADRLEISANGKYFGFDNLIYDLTP